MNWTRRDMEFLTWLVENWERLPLWKRVQIMWFVYRNLLWNWWTGFEIS